VITDDPQVLRKICGVRSPYTKSSWYKAWRAIPGQDSVFTMTNDAEHQERKAKVAPAVSACVNSHGLSTMSNYRIQYGVKDVEPIEKGIDIHVAKLVDLIDRKYITTGSDDYRALDFTRTAQFVALDIISELAWGQAFGFLDQDEDLHDYLKLFDEFFPVMTAIVAIPGLPWLMQQWPFSKMSPKPVDKAGFGKLMG
jgi:hypothetical protein